MTLQNKKSSLFIGQNSYQTRTVEQEIDALEYEGRTVNVIEEDGDWLSGKGVTIEWSYTEEELAEQQVGTYIRTQLNEYKYNYNVEEVCREAQVLVGARIKFCRIIEMYLKIQKDVDAELQAISEAECRAERGPSCENWGPPHPLDY